MVSVAAALTGLNILIFTVRKLKKYTDTLGKNSFNWLTVLLKKNLMRYIRCFTD